MNEVHRTLLTYLRATKLVRYKDLRAAFETICAKLTNEPIDASLDDYIAAINTRIVAHGFKIDRRTHEISGDLMVIFINTAIDEPIKASTSYSVNELDAIKSILDNIVDLGFSLGKVNAHQLIADSLRRTLRESALLVDRLIDDGWLVLTSQERLVLSIRSLSELKHFLVDRYPNKLHVCKQCNELVTVGYLVDTEDPYHYRCYSIFNRNNPNERQLDTIGVDPETLVY